MTDKSYRIEYWVQDTIESGYWRQTELMTIETAFKLINNHVYCQGNILDRKGDRVAIDLLSCSDCSIQNTH